MLRKGLFGALFLLLSGIPVHAEEAVVSTRVCEPLTEGATARISPADDSALYIKVGERVAQAMTAAGHAVQESGAIDVYFTVAEAPVEFRESGPNLGTFSVGNPTDAPRALVLLNVWSSRKDSILGGRKSKSGSRFSNYLLMAIEVNTRETGKCIWRGEGAIPLSGANADRVATRLADAIMRYLGKSADQERVLVE